MSVIMKTLTLDRLKAIAALACLVEEDDEEVFTPDVIHLLLLHFSLAILDQNHQSCYCSVAAILSGTDSSNHRRSGGRMFFSRVDFLC